MSVCPQSMLFCIFPARSHGCGLNDDPESILNDFRTKLAGFLEPVEGSAPLRGRCSLLVLGTKRHVGNHPPNSAFNMSMPKSVL